MRRATYLPYPFRIIQGDDDILFVYSYGSANRPVHMSDHLSYEEVPVDQWMGWSNGRWEGDTLVVEVHCQPRSHVVRSRRQLSTAIKCS